MRHLVALPVVAALALGGSGCAQLGLQPVTSADTTAFIQQVQTLTAAACGFVPAASTITGLLTAGNSAATAGLALGSTIASLICDTVKAVPVAGGTKLRGFSHGEKMYGRARGVPVIGRFE